MKKNTIRALIIGTVFASTVSLGSNLDLVMASEKNSSDGTSVEKKVEDNDNIDMENEKDYGGFYRGDMSGGDAALGLDKGEATVSYSSRAATPTINGIKVSKQLIDINYTKGVSITPKYIVIHDTDNRRAGADAQANRDYFANHPNANASAHYIVDQGNIVQALEDNWKGWHVGDGGASAAVNNSNTIGIELAVNAGNSFSKTFDNGVALTRYLMQKYNISADRVVMHKHASGKTCSRMMIEDNPNLWASFKSKVAKGMPGESNVNDGKSPTATGTLVNVGSYINIRQKPDAYSTVLSKLYKNGKVEIYGEENGYYKVSYMEEKKGYGYISKSYVKLSSGTVPPDDETPEPPNIVIKKGQVTGISTSLNVRSGAGTNYSSIGTLKPAQSVDITGESGNWYKINFNGKTGYVSKDYIKVTTDSNVTPEPPNTVTKKGQVTGISTSLNVRSGAGTSYDSIGKLSPNQSVDITGESGNWYKINFNGKTGYVSKDYIKVTTDSNIAPEPPNTVTKKGQVTGISSSLNVRSGPGTNYSSIGSLKPSQEVTITGESGSWYKINFNGKTGYVSKDYIKVGSDSGTTPTPSPILKVGKVTGISSTLNVRFGASTNNTIIGTLKPNETVNITGETGSWYKINFNGKTGYVSKQYITIISNGDDSGSDNGGTPIKTIGTVYNISTKLNVRSAASSSASIIAYLYNGNTVEITGETGDWYKINLNGRIGYVSKSYIKKK